MYKTHINTVHVEVTDRCNAACPACPRSHSGGFLNAAVKNQELSLSYFKLLGKDFCSKIDSWNFCGTKGDPSAAQDLFSILEFLLECNPETFISIGTNGGARNKQFWLTVGELFKDTNCQVLWAIDGLEETNHIYRRNVKWSKLWENLLAYISTGARTGWEFSKFHHNMVDLPAIKYFCKENNIDLTVREPFGFEDIQELDADAGFKQLVRTMPVYEDVDGEYANLAYEILPHNAEQLNLVSNFEQRVAAKDFQPGFYDKSNWTDLKDQNIEISCDVSNKSSRQEIYLDSDGMILPCCYIASKYAMGDEQLQEMFGAYKEELIVSESNSIYNVLNHKVFQKTMPDAITGQMDDDVGYCITCAHHCKK